MSQTKTESFADLIAPLPMADFLAGHWEKTFLHARQAPDAFSRFFSLAEVDIWLAGNHGLLYVTAADGEAAQTRSYRPSEISLSVAYAAFSRGSLLVLESLNGWPAIQPLARALGREFYAEIEVSAYVAPKGTRVFTPHAAGHDTLVLQLEGERSWNLHEFWLLQRNPPEKKNLKFPLDWYGRPKTPVAASVHLEPGHALYIPRGMPYQAQPPEAASLHLEIEIQPLGWMDFFKIAIDCASLRSQDLRRSLPPGFLEKPEVGAGMKEVFGELLRQLPELTTFEEVLAAAKRNRVKQQDFPGDGHFAQVLQAGELTVDSLVERRPDVLCFAEQVTDIDKNTRSALFFGKELVAGPQFLAAASAFVRDNPRFRVSEIPGLDAKSQVVLARRLIVEGLLRQVPEDRG